MTEKMSEKVVRLMKTPNRIRNIGTIAHIDHGKCVSGDTKLVLADGSVHTAREIFKIAEIKGKLFQNEKEEVIYDTRSANLETFSLNKKTGNLEKKKIDLVWKLDGGEAISIKLRNGIKITTSPEHKYLVLDCNSLMEKKACEISLKDRIVCVRNIETNPNNNIKDEILKLLSKKRFYIFLKDEPAKEIKEKLMQNLKQYHKQVTDLSYPSFCSGIREKRYLLRDFLKVCELLCIDLDKVYDLIGKISFRQGAYRGKSSILVDLPKNFESLFYIAGLLFGDGHHKKFIVGKPELGEEFSRLIFEEFGIKTSLRLYDRTPELVTNRTILEILNSLFDYPKENKSHSIRISNFIQRSSKNLVAKFIRGYFDTDGTIEKGRRAISISSASIQMIEDLYFQLLRFGCISQKYYKKNTLYISGKSIYKFINEIDFGLKDKKERAKNIAKTIKGSLIYDVYNSSNSLTVNYSKGQLGLMQQKLLLNLSDLAFIEVTDIKTTEEKELFDFTISTNHNFMAEGAIIHNTTFSDSLIAGAGMISEELAGKQLVLDFRADEQERGITIDAANISMVHNIEGEEYLINLIDTPGHVDFGGEVTRAMRAVDGAIVLIDAVEGIMPQTETVLKQALRERVKPILFINKVDRLIREVKLTPEKMQERFITIINNVNRFITSISPEEYKQKWHVDVQEGSVAFGSAFHKWALSFDYMQKNNISFKDIIKAYEEDKYKELAKKAPLHKVVLNMVIKHHPTPLEAQKYRIPKIWHGDLESEEGKALINCDPKGPVCFVVTKIVIDKHAGEVAAGRLFSGTLKQGQDVYMNLAKKSVRVQQVSIYSGAKRDVVDDIPAGNITGAVGLRGVFVGETVSEKPMEPFEAIKHIFEPVVTKSIEAKKPSDLARLVEVLKQVQKEDPSIKIEINEETGENIMRGMGELHLEVIENRIRTEKGLDIQTSNPIVVYREAIRKKSIEVEGKSPNKHNKFYFIVEPVEDNVYEAIKSTEIPEGRIKSTDRATWEKFVQLGYETKEARSIRDIVNSNILIDNTRGIVHIGEIIEMVMDAFEDVMNNGPVAREPCIRVKVRLMDTKLHEDAIHRGPAQVLPAVRTAIREAMTDAITNLFEPLQIIQIECPVEFMGEISKLVQNKRGQMLEMNQEGEHISVKAKLPVAEMFGLASELRSATEGRGSYYVSDQVFEKLPEELQKKVVKQIRQRKGLKLEEES